MSALRDIFAPVSAPKSAPPSPKVTLKIGDAAHIHKLGWTGNLRVAEIVGEHIRIESTLCMFGYDRALWFHYTELAPGAACSETCPLRLKIIGGLT